MTHQRTLRGAPDADGAQLDVALQRRRPEQLGKRPARATPAHVHLEQPVLGVHVPLHEVEVVVIAGLDVRDPIVVARHLGGGLQPRQL